MQVLESEHNAGGIEGGSGLVEDVIVDVHHEITPAGVLHHEAHVLAGLEASEQVDQEWVSHTSSRLEDALFGHKTLDFVPGDDVPLFQSLDGKVFATLFVLTQYHLKMRQ